QPVAPPERAARGRMRQAADDRSAAAVSSDHEFRRDITLNVQDRSRPSAHAATLEDHDRGLQDLKRCLEVLQAVPAHRSGRATGATPGTPGRAQQHVDEGEGVEEVEPFACDGADELAIVIRSDTVAEE